MGKVKLLLYLSLIFPHLVADLINLGFSNVINSIVIEEVHSSLTLTTYLSIITFHETIVIFFLNPVLMKYQVTSLDYNFLPWCYVSFLLNCVLG